MLRLVLISQRSQKTEEGYNCKATKSVITTPHVMENHEGSVTLILGEINE
jgi:hypothetical protein